jgi:hypothetical protein
MNGAATASCNVRPFTLIASSPVGPAKLPSPPMTERLALSIEIS